MNGKKFIKDNLFVLICAAITFVCVLSAAITFRQHPLKTLPLFVSLVVMLLQARVSRYAFLLGGLNSVLYALSYSLMGLYASAIYALVSSFPLQIITFINWRRKTSGGVTELRKMSGGVRLLVLLGFALVWPAVYFTISSLPGATQSALDVTGTLIGLLDRFKYAALFGVRPAQSRVGSHIFDDPYDDIPLRYLKYYLRDLYAL